MQAVAAGQAAVVEALLATCAALMTRDEVQETALHYAVRAGPAGAAAALLRAGADPSARDVYGNTPLDVARDFNHPEVAVLLEAHGAEPKIYTYGGWVAGEDRGWREAEGG